MTQRLSDLLRAQNGVTWTKFSPVKTKRQIRSAASRKAWVSRKRQKAARASVSIKLIAAE